ncbi:hypothetical protein J3458_019602 [Metarhizium acridum]|uniref:uncharacterized protein n=1 Tax=Metarhizium acridum TaxID=92637 RepID=UPI001C6AC6B6|nr:hypothetical protein J3458_019602 [Metarhizium acridum]
MSSLRMVVLGSAVATASAIAGDFHNTTATPHVVYTTEVVTALTTYCPAPTVLTQGTKTYTVTSATTLTITDCPCTISKTVQPTAVPTGTPGGDECAKKCTDAYNQCRGEPGANQSTCASKYAACLGYNPFQGNGFVTPNACSSTPGVSTTAGVVVPTGPGATAAPSKPASPSQPAGGNGCLDNCSTAYDKCRGEPGANLSPCFSNNEACKSTCSGTKPAPPAPTVTGAKPSGNSTNPPVTAGAGAMAPAKVLLALGAIALL